MTATTITAARSSLSWLAATPAAPRAAVPMNGTPAQEAATARNSSRYCHHVLPRPAITVRSADDQVDAFRDEPATHEQAPCDDDLVGVGVHPGPEPGQERLALGGPEPSVDLQAQVRRCGQDAEQGQREVTDPAGQFGRHDRGRARADQHPG